MIPQACPNVSELINMPLNAGRNGGRDFIAIGLPPSENLYPSPSLEFPHPSDSSHRLLLAVGTWYRGAGRTPRPSGRARGSPVSSGERPSYQRIGKRSGYNCWRTSLLCLGSVGWMWMSPSRASPFFVDPCNLDEILSAYTSAPGLLRGGSVNASNDLTLVPPAGLDSL
jgi:hypothetical protein